MESNTDFDKNFKDQISQMDFEFKESYWIEMEAMLNQKKKRRGLIFWLWSSLSLTAVLALGMIYLYNSGEKSNEEIGNLQVNTPVDNKVETQKSPSYFEHSIEKNSSQSKAYPEANSSNNHLNNQLVAGQNSAQSSRVELGVSKHDKQNPKANLSPKSTLQTSKSELKKEAGNSLSTKQQNFEMDLSNQENRFDFVKLPIASFDESQSFTQNPNQVLNIQTADQPKNKEIRSHVGVVAGLNSGQSLKHNNESVGGIGTHIGLRFYFASQQGFLFNTGLSFGMNGIQGLVYEEHRTIYGFTHYDVVNLIEYNTMTTAHIPIYLGYEAYRFSLSGGVRLNYLMNTKGRVFAYDNSIYDANIWGYANGVKMFNMSAGFEGTYQLGRRFDLGISMEVDFSPRTENGNPYISSNAQMMQFGMFLKYRLN